MHALAARLPRGILVNFVAMLILLAAEQYLHADSNTKATGTVEGTVIYQADPQRLWRHARYYVKDAQTGQLAEAVVTLRSKALRELADHRPAETHSINQKNFQFLPETLAIRAGDSVTFTNDDRETHNVKCSGRIAEFNVNTAVGVDYTHRFQRAGGIRQPVLLGCVFHGSMRAWIYIFDHPHYHVTEDHGRFRFENIPPGEHELELRHPAGELRWRQRIRVRANATTHIDITLSPDDKFR